MRTFLSCFLLVSSVVISIGCDGMVSVNIGNGPTITGSNLIVEQEREVDPFEKIEFRGAGTVEITSGDIQSVKVSVDDNLQDVIETTVQDKTLTIKPNQNISQFKLNVKIVVPKISSLKVAGAGVAKLKDLTGDELEVRLSGATRVEGNGEVKTLTVRSSGASKIVLDKLIAESVSLVSSGAGSASIHATADLTAKVSGVGSVTCYGKPAKVSKDVSGMGSIHLAD